jgi:uncharacterized membrane protein YfcA
MEVLVGCVAGFCIGATGVGGGLVTAPLLILLFGIPAEIAIATTMLFLAAARLQAGILYYRRGKIAWRALTALLLGGIPGALIGPWALRRVAENEASGAVLLAIGLVVVSSSALSFLPAVGRSGQAGAARRGLLPWAGFLTGAILGFSSAGAGSLGALALLHLTDLEPASVVGTNVVAGLALSLTAGLVFLATGSVNGSLLLKMAAGGLAGVSAGVLTGARARVGGLRTAISAWSFVLGAILVGRGLWSCLS